MLKISRNTVKVLGINVAEEIYLRNSFTTREGEPATSETIYAWLGYKAYTVSGYKSETEHIPTFAIDNLPSEIRVEVYKNYKYGWRDYNELFVAELLKIGIPAESISIVE